MTVTATLQVQFQGANKNGLLTAEVDSRPDGYNGGRTTFTFGDEPVFLVRKSPNVTITAIKTSVGTVTKVADGVTQEEDFLTYYNSKSATTAKPISGNLEGVWYGQNLGRIKKGGDNEVVINESAPVTEAGVLGVTYDSNFTAYRLTGVPAKLNGKSAFTVFVVFIGQVDPEA